MESGWRWKVGMTRTPTVTASTSWGCPTERISLAYYPTRNRRRLGPVVAGWRVDRVLRFDHRAREPDQDRAAGWNGSPKGLRGSEWGDRRHAGLVARRPQDHVRVDQGISAYYSRTPTKQVVRNRQGWHRVRGGPRHARLQGRARLDRCGRPGVLKEAHPRKFAGNDQP